jgi:serine/threonine protein kinase
VQEVQLLQSLHHPNIIAMLDSFIEDNELIIVFEWALGGDLKRLIRRQIESGVAMDESLIWGHFTQVSCSPAAKHRPAAARVSVVLQLPHHCRLA